MKRRFLINTKRIAKYLVICIILVSSVLNVKADSLRSITYEKNRQKFRFYTTGLDYSNAKLYYKKVDRTTGRVLDIECFVISSTNGVYTHQIMNIQSNVDFCFYIFDETMHPLFKKLKINSDTPNGTGNSGYDDEFTPYY